MQNRESSCHCINSSRTVRQYFDAVFAAKKDFPLYKGDFFPYADNSDSYWTVRTPHPPELRALCLGTRRGTHGVCRVWILLGLLHHSPEAEGLDATGDLYSPLCRGT